MMDRRAVMAAMGAAGLALPARAAETGVSGWREAVLITPDAAPWVETLTAVGGWEVAWKGRSDAGQSRLWGLPASARGREVLMRNKGTDRGYIRLVTLSGVPQQRIRSNDQAWEIGGIMDLDIRVTDMAASQKALEARGWSAGAEPVTYEFGKFKVIEWLPKSPDGVRLALIQRLAPALVGWPELKRWSRAFNTTIVVPEIETGHQLIGDGLGFGTYSQSKAVAPTGLTVMALPKSVAMTLISETLILGPGGLNDGSIEMITMPQEMGRNFAETAKPPNFGLAALRFPVRDATALAASLQARGVVLASPMVDLNLAPYGPVRSFAVRGPQGAWFEMFQPL